MSILATMSSINPVVAVFLAGVLITFVGHLVRTPRLVAMGIAVIFLATVAMFTFGYLVYRRDT